VKKGATKGLKYKVHVSIKNSKRIIVDCHITTGAVHDSVVYLEMLRQLNSLSEAFDSIDSEVSNKGKKFSFTFKGRFFYDIKIISGQVYHCIIIPMILKDHQTEKNVILRMFADYWETFKAAYPIYDSVDKKTGEWVRLDKIPYSILHHCWK
jgi:hypothetical protein